MNNKENKYKNCQSQEERDLVDQGFKLCVNFSCGQPYKDTHDIHPQFCSSMCYAEYN